MFSPLIVVVDGVALSAFSKMALAQCPCYDLKDYTVCEDPSLTSIPDCVADDIISLNIRTPSIPLVADTIRRFTHLTGVDISYFDNPEISKTFLSAQPNISSLGIFHTSLDYVDNDWFLYTPMIKTMFLHNNKIASLAPDTFSFLPELSRVTLDFNQLTTLPPTLLEGTSLKNLNIRENPWHCDCEMATFMQWVRDNGVTLTDPAFCLHPEQLEGLDFSILTPELACKKTNQQVTLS